MEHKDTVYITTTLPYVNARPHIGFALELVQADALARYFRHTGKKVFFNFGTDEHGLKVYRTAHTAGVDPQTYVDGLAEHYKRLAEVLSISEHNFIRTTDKHHKMAAQEFWKRCEASGDIYKKQYTVKYCVGCELEKTESELNEEGRCPLHPKQEVEFVDEENYFFRFSRYQNVLSELYQNNPAFVVPAHRQKEIATFVAGGLQDFSISRLKEKLPWGVLVPGDPKHCMYVWFDALVNYVSAIGWPDRMEEFKKWWPVLQIAGKDNLRQQAAMWQAMLISAGLPTSAQIMIHGFFTIDGHKMSKSSGNVVDPEELVATFGVDALRYFLLREVQPFEDSDFTRQRFIEAYNANLANGIGNLTSRIMKMATTYSSEAIPVSVFQWPEVYCNAIESYRFNEAADYVWERIGVLDARIQEEQPFKVAKVDVEKAKHIIVEMVNELHQIANLLASLLPKTSDDIMGAIVHHQMPEPLFKRVEM
ncbi:MAG: methionine--tRNA ligase [bacterium]|nr:methionine--tRNA ligase [bacterium]